ncbi:2659_t:CDS:2 [Acaulospora morrowiae]|uniref:2659_t:CDS:1 n=1 Tax=Acaulospora morrowiae TaxID=94023 RepID=A0A9N8VMC3_9GLOM|nr:2659_t:CDS:2 [Acaulospora morrowiae]
MKTLDKMIDHLTLEEPDNINSEQIMVEQYNSIETRDDTVIENSCETMGNGKESRESILMPKKNIDEKSNVETVVDEAESLGLESVQLMNSGNDDMIANEHHLRDSLASQRDENKGNVIFEDVGNQDDDFLMFQKSLEIKENYQSDTHDTSCEQAIYSPQNVVEKERNIAETVENAEKDDEHDMRLETEKDRSNELRLVGEKEVEDFNYELLGIIDDESCDSLIEIKVSNRVLCVEEKAVINTKNNIENTRREGNNSFYDSLVDKRKSINDIHGDIVNDKKTSIKSLPNSSRLINDTPRDKSVVERTFGGSLVVKKDSVSDIHHDIANVNNSSNNSLIEKIESVIDTYGDATSVEKRDDLTNEAPVDKRQSMIDIHNDTVSIENGNNDLFIKSLVDERKSVSVIQNETSTIEIKTIDHVVDDVGQLNIENDSVKGKSFEFEKSDTMVLDSFGSRGELNDVTEECEEYASFCEKLAKNQFDESTSLKYRTTNSVQNKCSHEVSRIIADDIYYESTKNYFKNSISHQTPRELNMEDLLVKEGISGNTADHKDTESRQSEIINSKVNEDDAILRLGNLSIHSSDNDKLNTPKPSTSPTFFSPPYVEQSPEFSKMDTELNYFPFSHMLPTEPIKQYGSRDITVEEYLRDMTEEQNKKLIMKTSQMIEELLEVKRKAKNAIMSIPVI